MVSSSDANHKPPGEDSNYRSAMRKNPKTPNLDNIFHVLNILCQAHSESTYWMTQNTGLSLFSTSGLTRHQVKTGYLVSQNS